MYLNYGGPDMSYFNNIVQQERVRGKETPVNKVVVFNPCKRLRSKVKKSV